jgi:hypothetical protein
MILLLSCGIDDVAFLEPVEDASVAGVASGTVRLPDNDSNIYFRFYMIYYRIYTSNTSPTTIDTGISQHLIDINPALAADYNSLNPYVVNENIISSNMETVFENRRYYKLCVSTDKVNETTMNNLLSSSNVSSGTELNFDFTNPSSEPFMTRGPNISGATQYFLFRASGKFTIAPDRLFYLSNDLITNVNDSTNLDVNLFSNTILSDSQYAFVSMYIIACGIDNTFSQVYSRPKHIGIFQLPN